MPITSGLNQQTLSVEPESNFFGFADHRVSVVTIWVAKAAMDNMSADGVTVYQLNFVYKKRQEATGYGVLTPVLNE